MNTKNILTEMNLQDTHWGRRIIQAEERGEFSDKDIELAESWVTCACGKTSHDIPRRDGLASPVDDKLREYGEQFEIDLEDNDFTQAALTLIDIEQRAAIVAAENTK